MPTVLRLISLGLISALGVLAAAAPARLLGQTPASPPAARVQEAQKAEITAVVVDVVVRDGKGQPVTDLTQADFTIEEDGVPQDIGSFRVITPGPGGVFASAAAAGGAPSAPTPSPARAAPEPAVVALVFDRLTPDGRSLTQKAAQRYVGEAQPSPNVLAVFSVDIGLEVLQGFTRDTAQIRRALGIVGKRGSTVYGQGAERSRTLQNEVRSLDSAATAGAGGVGPNAGQAAQAAAGASVEQHLRQIELRMLQGLDLLEREQQGYSSTSALTAIVSAMKLMPGRKTLIYFSEGMSVPSNIEPRFRAIIDEANRANVSVYSMDAAGLRAESKQAETRDQINAYGAGALVEGGSGSGASGGRGIGMRAIEDNENLMRNDPASALGQLSRETGGFLIQSSNDMTAGFRRIDQDIRNHYVLTYVSKRPEYDGKFRHLEVRVKRPALTVSARKGYYAIRPTGGVPVLAYEAAPLAILDAGRPPNAFPVRTRSLVFPMPGSVEARVPILASTKADQLQFKVDEAGNRFSAEMVILARVRDVSGQVLIKMSQPYTFAGGLGELPGAKAAEVLFYRQHALPPGVYTVETIVYDVQAEKASVRIASIEVPTAAPGTSAEQVLRVGTPFVVQRAEKVAPGDRDAQNPLYFGELLLYPNLGEPISKASTSELSFAFTVQPPKGTTATAKLSLLHGGAVVAELPLPLAEPDSLGTVLQVSRLPLAPIPPGTYELRITVEAGGKSVTRTVPFSIAQ
jgi:VWFA-related protein